MHPWWNNYIRTPFKEKGRDLAGVDCWGLAAIIYEGELGIILPSYTDFYENTEESRLLAKLIADERANKWDHPETPKMFDIIILKLGGVPFHVGVVTKPNHMIHCAKDVGTTHVRFDTLEWDKKVVGFARYKQ